MASSVDTKAWDWESDKRVSTVITVMLTLQPYKYRT